MSKVFDEIKAGLVDAVIYARGDTSKGRVHTQQKPDEQEVIAYAIKDVLERIERGEEIIHDDPDGMKKIRERVLKEHRETS